MRAGQIGAGPSATAGASDAVAFSFYATKNLTTGEGGMITTHRADLAGKMRMLALHGVSHDAWDRYTDRGGLALRRAGARLQIQPERHSGRPRDPPAAEAGLVYRTARAIRRRVPARLRRSGRGGAAARQSALPPRVAPLHSAPESAHARDRPRGIHPPAAAKGHRRERPLHPDSAVKLLFASAAGAVCLPARARVCIRGLSRFRCIRQ